MCETYDNKVEKYSLSNFLCPWIGELMPAAWRLSTKFTSRDMINKTKEKYDLKMCINLSQSWTVNRTKRQPLGEMFECKLLWKSESYYLHHADSAWISF